MDPDAPLPAFCAYAADVAPDKADSVPAKADVDQVGRLEAKGFTEGGAGFND